MQWIAEEAPRNSAAAATTRRSRRSLVWAGIAGAALTAAVLAAAAASLWPRPGVAEYFPATFRKGAISSARFTPDGLSFVYSASWEGQPYAAFLGRPGNPDARDLQLPDARIMSISRAGDMAVLFGSQNITHTWGVRMLARIPDGRWIASRLALRGGGRRLDSRAPTRSPLSETPGATVTGPSSFPPARPSTKRGPRGRCECRRTAVAWRSSRVR